MLFSSSTVSMALSFLAIAVQLRWMDPADRGRLVLALPIITLSALAFDLGAFPAGARMLAIARDREGESRTLGALVLVGLGVGLALSLFLLAIAYPADLIFRKNIRDILLLAAPLAFFLPFQAIAQESCQGLNQIARLSLLQLLQASLNLAFQAGLAMANRLTAKTALMAYLAAIAISSLWTISRMRPEFGDRRHYLRLTLGEIRRYGFNVYLARMTGAASTQIDNLVIGYLVADTVPLSLYDGAQRLSNPIITIARSIAITRFRSFASRDRVTARISRWNAAVLIVCAVGLAVVGPFALPVVFPKYADAAPLLIPFAAWSLFGGLFQPYNMFLSAHGRGAEIRNIAIVTMITSIIALAVCVPRWGIAGAAWAAATTMALDYAVTLYYYQKFRKSLSQSAVKP